MQHVSAIVYAGSAVGAVFAGDLVTLFVFWEILGLSSAFLVWASRDEHSAAAGIRYLLYQVGSGVLLMAGLIWYAATTGSIAFGELGADSTATMLILVAFGIKAGFPLVHNWITDAYPASTPTGTVFLCAFTTKVAVYALARGFSRHGGADLHRCVHGLLPDLFRGHRKRPAPRTRLLDDQPARLHGRGRRHRFVAGAQWRGCTRVQRCVFQGIVVHVDGRRTLCHRAYQGFRSRRAVSQNADYGHTLRHRRDHNLGVPAVQCVRQQVHGDECLARGRPLGSLACHVVRFCRCTGTCRHQDPVLRLLRP